MEMAVNKQLSMRLIDGRAPAITTRGMKETEMVQIAAWIDEAIKTWQDATKLADIRQQVVEMTKKFPLYS